MNTPERKYVIQLTSSLSETKNSSNLGKFIVKCCGSQSSVERTQTIIVVLFLVQFEIDCVVYVSNWFGFCFKTLIILQLECV